MNTLREFVNLLADELTRSGRYGTVHAYKSAVCSLIRFSGNEQLSFADLIPALLKAYEQQLLAEGSKRNTISLYMRMLRSVCNQASERGITRIPEDLFRDVFTGTDPSQKRAAKPGVIRRLLEMDLEKYPELSFSRDLFLLSFYLRGIPFVDLVHLRKSDIQGGVLQYRRRKTGRLLTVSLESCAQAVLRKYAELSKQSPYLLPVISLSGKDGYRQYQNALRLYNKHLHRLSDLLGLKENLTSYVARHSWATAAYREGIPVAVISESLGHASEKVTYSYLASFDNRTLRQVNRRVIALTLKDPVSVQESRPKPAIRYAKLQV